jgi:hypothetical protein
MAHSLPKTTLSGWEGFFSHDKPIPKTTLNGLDRSFSHDKFIAKVSSSGWTGFIHMKN